MKLNLHSLHTKATSSERDVKERGGDQILQSLGDHRKDEQSQEEVSRGEGLGSDLHCKKKFELRFLWLLSRKLTQKTSTRVGGGSSVA